MNDIQPIGYDAVNEIVLIPGGGWKVRYFIETAIIRFYAYDDPSLLLWAVDAGLPQLMESAAAREVFKRLIETGKIRGKGKRPSANIRADKLRNDVLRRIWFHCGRGFAVYNNPESNATGLTACDLVKQEGLCSASRAHQIWKEAGGHDPQGAIALASWFWMGQGKVTVK
jgi:hypothetical protein